jgi:hypothetical protein
MKQSLRYDQTSCRLQVHGLPDASAGQGSLALGIITGWNLQWIGRPELEGRREHLEALMGAVLPYARHLISGVARPFGTDDQPVTIGPDPEDDRHHRLELRSSQPDTPPLQVRLDDAELADLVRVLDQLLVDPRLQLKLSIPTPQPLRPRELMERMPPQRRLAAPVGGAAALLMAGALAFLIPTPPPPSPAEATPAASPAQPVEGGKGASPSPAGQAESESEPE